MKKTSIAFKNIKGGVKVFANAVPKDEVKTKDEVKPKEETKPKEVVMVEKQEVSVQPSPKREVINEIVVNEEETVKSKPLPAYKKVEKEISAEELLLSLKSGSDDILNVKKQQKTKSISVPLEVNMNDTISKMYEKLGSSTEIKGYNGPACHTFDAMKLNPLLLKSIYGELNFEYPSPIQSVGTMPVIEGRDALVQAQAGTGKTATYMIAALQKTNPAIRGCQTIVLSPTRELSEQTFEVSKKLATHMNVSIASHIGGIVSKDIRGVSYAHNVKSSDVGHYEEQIVIATPGRLLMLLNRGFIKVENIKLVILDEADNILSQGFMEDIGNIFIKVPENVQIALYSATLSNEIIELSTQFMIEPVQILVPQQEHVMTDNQSQYTVQVDDERKKLNVLSDVFTTSTGQTIIFCNRKHTVNYIYDHIKSLGIPVGCINGEMEQAEREQSMERFRKGTYKVLIGTDIIARGIDTVVNLVINYDIPNIPTQYVHRCGRTGRFGKHGYVLNIVNNDEVDKIKRINHRFHIKALPYKQFMERSAINI